MAVTRTVTINSVTFYPDSIDGGVLDKVGEEIQTENGTMIYLHAGTTGTWVLKWASAPESVRTSLATIAGFTSTTSFTDQYGNSHSVYVPPGGFKEQVHYPLPDSNYAAYYELEITLKGA
jgi:hypothetical protein